MPFLAAHPTLLRALAERGYTEPTPVQAAVLEPEGARRDLLVSAQTGSGKTVAYGLAMAPTLLDDAETFAHKTPPQALIVAPTRELAQQVQRELSWLYAGTNARVVSCVGGMDPRREQRQLAMGAHIVVGTPGRLCDHLDRKALDASHLKVVVLDEADEMLDLGFRDDLERILETTPTSRRTLLFSATLPKGIAALAKQYTRDAYRIATSADREPHGDIEYRAVQIVPRERDHAVINVLRHAEARGALVFCSTREGVKHLYGNLFERGFAVVALSGELSQSERNHALQALRDGRARVCVATDVAARGLDLPDLGLVIHADLPRDRATLLHRSGRTGRAGRKGVCVLLVPPAARRLVESVLGAASIDAQWSAPPTPEEIRIRDQERLVRDIAELVQETAADEDLAAAQLLLAERTPQELAAALVRMQRQSLPAAEEVSDSIALVRGNGKARPQRSEQERAERDATMGADAVWFRMNIGRAQNADPRWLVPLICRKGQVGKEVIGKIRIGQRDTQFEIAGHAADQFASAARRPDKKDPQVKIAPVTTPDADERRPRS